jgi:hypothetical protein
LDNLLGFVYSEQEYNHYFQGFLTAQTLRLNTNRKPSPLDRVKDNMNWKNHYQSFLTTQTPMSEIKVVLEYKNKMKNAASGNTFGKISSGMKNLGLGLNRKFRR